MRRRPLGATRPDTLFPYTTLFRADLISLVQIGVLELHPWGSRADDVDHPDRVIFDLDPDPSVSFERVVAAAQELHDRLDQLGLKSFLQTTGGKGLHVVVPLARRPGCDRKSVV